MTKKLKRIKININRRYQRNRIDKKKVIIIFLLTILLLSSSVSFARVAYTKVKDFYLATKRFYFNSDKLSTNGSIYEIDNWSGVGSYEIVFNMNSFANNKLFSEEDIDYTISYSCSSNVICQVENNKTGGTISASTNTDYFTVIITVPPTTILRDRDRVELEVEVNSTSPYKKKLKGEFSLVVGYYGLSYEIEDKTGRPYLETKITNTLDYYTVTEAFGIYTIGTQLDEETYQTLSNENKEKCTSATVTLTFDPREVLLDMTTHAYLIATNTTVTNINGYDYINSISFPIKALSSEQVKFYKITTSNNYTYPFGAATSVINVSYS